jgi:hypothetical protein
MGMKLEAQQNCLCSRIDTISEMLDQVHRHGKHAFITVFDLEALRISFRVGLGFHDQS